MSISATTKRLLLARSGGYCQNPECNSDLYPQFEDGTITNVEELAHIIAQKEDGPRGENVKHLSNRDEYDNIILLCPTCHSKIDKNPDKFSVETLHKWKDEHEEKIRSNFHVPTYDNRPDLRSEIFKVLAENNAIFNQYGPQSEFAMNSTQSEASKMWETKSIETLIPNNRKIFELLNKNYALLNEYEYKIVADFKIHKEGFEYNKLSGDKNSAVPLFPKEINEILN
jgi:hypothetical protein